MRDSTGATAAISSRLYHALKAEFGPEFDPPDSAPGMRVVTVPDPVFRQHMKRIESRRKRNKIGAATRRRQRAARQ
jgi:hypothetical protein